MKLRRIFVKFFLGTAGLLFFCSPALCAARPGVISNEPITTERCNQFTFDASGSYDPDSQSINYLWDFGDGSSSTKDVITHTYDHSGDYTVILTVTDTSNQTCSTAIKKTWVYGVPSGSV